jgi:ubiquinone/menaquinone biosynthesis C-methylase UbiE
MARVDYEAMAAGYDAARAIPLEGLDAWRRALSLYLPPGSGLPVLDLGSGTGQFAHALVLWFEVRVIGIEPSARMRAEAEGKRSHPRIVYLAGAAEEIPLEDASCGCAWLSTVIHHVGDLRACARELRRVLAPAARVLVRNAFPGRLAGITLFRFFPEARRIAETFPTVSATVRAFAEAGFSFESLEGVPQVTAPSLSALRERVTRRADTTLAPLGDEEFERGLGTLDRAIAAEEVPRPVVDTLDLLVLRGGASPDGVGRLPSRLRSRSEGR